MGREFDGSYAEYALLPDALLMPVSTTLPWETLAALPETYLTAQGAYEALQLGRDARLLIRGGTSSVGMAAASIARGHGIEVAATTRRPEKAAALRAAGVDHVIVDGGGGGGGGGALLLPWATGPSHVLDLVGADTVVDSLRLVGRGGTVCVAGSLSGWLLRDFEPIAMIPSGARLTAFHSNDAKGKAGVGVLQRVVRNVETGVYRPNVDRIFDLDDIAAAHEYMEGDQATGKVLLRLDASPPGPRAQR
jgi:NADPH:quinone reductase-like Zn-dependent oxidoreductase